MIINKNKMFRSPGTHLHYMNKTDMEAGTDIDRQKYRKKKDKGGGERQTDLEHTCDTFSFSVKSMVDILDGLGDAWDD